MTPIILHKLGTSGYGTWAVFLALSSMTSLADLGMVGTLSKHVAEYHARRESEAMNRVLNTGLVIFVLIAMVVAALLLSVSSIGPTLLFRGSPMKAAELITLSRYFLIVIVANILTLLFSSVTSGLQRLDLTNWISLITIYCAASVGIILLYRGWGLRALIFGQVCSSLLGLVIYIVIVKRLLPESILSIRFFDATEAKKMFHFSLRLYLTQAAVAVHNQIEKFLLAFFTGVAAAGWYDIASDVALKLRAVLTLVLGPVLPAASELDALQDEKRLEELYFRTQKYLAFFGVPLTCFVGIISSRFVELWLGPRLAFLGIPLAILLAVNFFNLLTGPGFLIFAGRGNLGPGMQSAGVGLILNVFLSTGLIYRFGFAGAVLGTAISIISASTYFLYLFHRATGYSIVRLFREAFLKPLAISLFLGLILLSVIPSSAPSWLGLIALGMLFAFLYLAILLFSHFFDRYDWSKFESLIPAIRHARRIIPVA
jgi:O-antigen/teichoic acid export membrane protein